MKRLQRLTSPRDFKHVLARGKRITTSGATLAFVRRLAGEPARVGVMATRKIGGAVQRNRAKRVLREAARRAEFPAGVDAVLIATPELSRRSFPDLEREITVAVQEIPAC